MTDGWRKKFESLVRSPKTAQNLAFRVKIVLLVALGKTADDLVVELGTTLRTIYRWRKRFNELDIRGLNDRPRNGQPQKSTDEKVKEVLRMTVECIPRKGYPLEHSPYDQVRPKHNLAGATDMECSRFKTASAQKFQNQQ